MAAINPNDLAKFKWLLYIRAYWDTWAYTRLASVRWMVSNLDATNVIDVKADDTGSVYKVVDVKATIEAELLENMWRDTLDMLFTGTTSNTAAAPVVGATQDITNPSSYDLSINMENNMGDGTEVTVTGVSGSTDWALTVDTDYVVILDPNGKSAIYFVSGWNITTLTQTFTVTYNYTPNASEDITISIDSTSVKSFDVKIEATDSGKARTIQLDNASFSSSYWMSFADIIEQWDITWATLVFDANKGSNLIYTNEIT